MSTQNPQYMVKKLVPHWRFWKQASPEKYGSGPVGLLKNLWGECSEMVLCGGIALFSIGMMYYKYQEDKKTGASSNKPYKEYYTVYRPDDPRISRLRQEWFQNGAPPMTSVKLD
eukprot:TRINITY_DN20523_c0_g1_i1.p1 TRINITY_DN20523_c0_g1~~TRINITY_DN20523_c0_g1_i1.p1  ORF type:complete len:114 (-),score=26.85 TRINITY_DN20523_c0_g1_i1:70-411(-)